MKAVSTTNAPAAIGPYVQGMIVNGMFYSSGQIPLTAAWRSSRRFNYRANTSSICKFKSST